jgi:23S rRNA (pseudouridine1915-N3)-methyltransferase
LRIVVAAVGRFGGSRAKSAPARALFDNYVKRIAFPVELKEIEEKRPLSAAELKAREGELLLAATPKGATVVALDAAGRTLTSAEFARYLGGWRDRGVKDLAFVIGGADGLDRWVLDRAQLVLSLGPMTWPHLLARVLLVEQIYRAQCILQGHPYHRE